jgi:hypothetical protein
MIYTGIRELLCQNFVLETRYHDWLLSLKFPVPVGRRWDSIYITIRSPLSASFIIFHPSILLSFHVMYLSYWQLRKILWHIDIVLGSYREMNNETTAVVRQRSARKNGIAVGNGVFYVVRSDTVLRDRPSSVQLVGAVRWSGTGWLVGEWVGGLVGLRCFEMLLSEPGCWDTGTVRKPRRWPPLTETTGEDIAE